MLEDFFTLTEMKEGICTVERITDLVAEIQKLKDVVGLNKADLLRQCSTAANTLAVTKDQGCLQHFVQLEGVGFLTQWLQDAQKCSKDISGAAEDLILAILTALDSLPDSVRAVSCGSVLPSLQSLLVHANTEISQKARVLCQKWSSVPEECCADGQSRDTEEADQLKNSEASQDRENGEHGGANEAAVAEDGSNGSAILGDTSVSSAVSHGGSSEKLPSTEEISGATNDVDLASNGMLRSDSLEAKSGVAGQVAPPDVASDEAKSPEPEKPEHSFLSSTEMHVEDQDEPASLGEVKKDDPFSADVSDSEKDKMEDLNHLANVSISMHDSSDEERFGKEEAPTPSSSSDSDVNEYRFQRCMNSFGDSSKAAAAETKKSTVLKGDKKAATSMTEYDDTDALEVARMVAIEVEREVIDYREPFCDSPDINDSPDDLVVPSQQQAEPPIDEPIDDNNKSSTPGGNHESGSSSSLKEDGGSGITDDTGPVTRKHTRSGTEPLEDFDLNENQQCPEETETDWHTKSVLSSNSIHLSTPIAVAASRGGASSSVLFPARLHFEGEHGWKGSAATSAFRPASPRRNAEGDKSVLAPSSSQKAGNMFDLNFADDTDDAIADEPLSAAAIFVPASGLASNKDKSPALAPLSWGLQLDLNGPCDNEAAAATPPVPSSFWNNREQFTMSQPPSSSSSSRQPPPAVKSFDLNSDNMWSSHVSSRGVVAESRAKAASGKETSSQNHSEVVTILGKRIVVGQQQEHHRQQIQHNFLGPPSITESSRVVHARPTMQSSYAPPPSVDSGYPPHASALSYPPGGPMMSLGGGPYMVDARGAPFMLGSGAGFSHPSFGGGGGSGRAIIPPPSTELSYFHPSMGFSYGPSSYEGAARREEGGYWPVSFQGQNNMFVDERGTRHVSSQGGGSTSSSGMVVPKRKEPADSGGWDMFVEVGTTRRMSSQGTSSSGMVVPKRKEPDSGWDLFRR